LPVASEIQEEKWSPERLGNIEGTSRGKTESLARSIVSSPFGKLRAGSAGLTAGWARPGRKSYFAVSTIKGCLFYEDAEKSKTGTKSVPSGAKAHRSSTMNGTTKVVP
jgi:hypothetical protein